MTTLPHSPSIFGWPNQILTDMSTWSHSSTLWATFAPHQVIRGSGQSAMLAKPNLERHDHADTLSFLNSGLGQARLWQQIRYYPFSLSFFLSFFLSLFLCFFLSSNNLSEFYFQNQTLSKLEVIVSSFTLQGLSFSNMDLLSWSSKIVTCVCVYSYPGHVGHQPGGDRGPCHRQPH